MTTLAQMDARNVTLEMMRTCTRLFSRKTRRDERVSESHPSSTETVDQIDTIPPGPAPTPGPAAVGAAPAAGHGGGWTLSVILCVNILILGAALISCSAVNGAAVTPVHRQIFLIVLLSLTILWMLFYTIFTRRAVSSKDSHAGPLWLRVGLVLFGLLSLIMDMFMIANYSGRLHCDSPVKVAFPCIQAVFIFFQTYFLWIHAKDCVQLHKDLTRCGLTVTLSCNLVLWMSAVVEEYNHHTDAPENLTVRSLHRASFGDHKCKCSFTSCGVFKEAYYYLYPFNIEYSLFASAMAYVMWKNVGRLAEEHAHQRPKFRVKDVSVGPVAGILLVLTGLATFIVYEMQVVEEEQKNTALLIHFITNIVIVSLMSVCTAAGCLLFCLDQRPHVREDNPTRGLDVGLLVGASMGQLVISYFSVVALAAEGAGGHVNSLNLAWAVLTVVQLGMQNLFVIAGLHREPYQESRAPGTRANGTALSPVRKRRKLSFSLAACRHGLNWKRRLLKEICVFVLLANIILWIMPAFGARPQFDQTVEIHFYGFTMWAAIVNIGLPFGIFYRMHSVASLFEVYLIV
ncbi:proton channel OTOP2-like [Gadus macrocephalus]|uniref:proton channel OTOP2-like n=1 Tax=Gadus macrocephalus TaxID=80720 RepID=UPI0028CB5145|nr:proton channel OTOP2-like [Gadus macrocephalus]